MTIKDKLNDELKTAMKAGETRRRDIIRMVLAAIKQGEVDTLDPQKRATGLSDEDMLAVLTREAKRRRESISEYEKGGRADLVASEREELSFIETYLPQLMGRDEIAVLAREAIAESGATSEKQMGAIMQKLMPKVKGKADGKLVNQVVKELLSAR
ncbi:MAG: GatB/YqeY domain-containing protein [Chloroflexi bacterium]|nr:GatB/YqeY domain-containing protein [Chloroflexota bacterium]